MKYTAAVAALGIGILCLSSCAGAGNISINPNMIADLNPVSAGTIEAEFDRMLSSRLTQSNVEVIFYPRLNSVALEFKYQAVTYRQFWDLSARTGFIAGLERYKSDYEDRNLDTKYRKTKAAYGKARGRVEWETFKFTRTHTAQPVYEIGYRFREKKPFFSVLMLSTREEINASDNSPPMDSQQLTMYFTRAQAGELAALFDQTNLLALINITPAQNHEEIKDQDTGEYEEW